MQSYKRNFVLKKDLSNFLESTLLKCRLNYLCVMIYFEAKYDKIYIIGLLPYLNRKKGPKFLIKFELTNQFLLNNKTLFSSFFCLRMLSKKKCYLFSLSHTHAHTHTHTQSHTDRQKELKEIKNICLSVRFRSFSLVYKTRQRGR